ncbi:bifunctional DNA-formamidopyrimidine glycosylase/DNA-(apurinic or apyrimidinic site) lyase [Hydrogenophilus thiooxidans]|uniref:bifunctional DNA-formamidopyrimidine glycosylase/DNA-(apurinic or apyrimidinic site) lyase n=1 Tax=Hydrogenophilus thiooxidans TaxID=2820326 RepID=UPI001C222C57|nr:bifunctional DNA-formamidopyrimidine glycosylase/DNA-(apurinic or apyrimidinic site) lyase [Hydrogenophilus thiooxidans]
MPELPEVETVKRGLLPLIGQRWRHVTVRRADLRRPLDASAFSPWRDATVCAVTRRAKVVALELVRADGARAYLRFHLGMSGRLYFTDPASEWLPHEHLELAFSASVLRFRDPRRFGWCDLLPADDYASWSATLAPEPFSPELTPEWAMRRAGRSSIKAVLLSGRVVVGVGNIYACEALYRAGIAPQRLAATLSAEEWAKLIAAVRAVLEAAIAAGGTSLRDYVTVDGAPGWFQVQLAVYGRAGQPCVRCGTPIERIVQQGRSTWWCPRCQAG